MKIYFKLILGFLIVASLVGVVGYFSITSSQKALQESIGENSVMLAQETLDEIDHILYEKQISIKLLAGSHTPKHFLTEIMELGTSPAHPLGGVVEDLSLFAGADSSVWRKIFFIDLKGEIKASNNEKLIGKKLSEINDLGLEEALSGEEFFSDVLIEDLTEELTIVFAMPVRKWSLGGDKKEVVGAVVGHLNLDVILDALSEVETEEERAEHIAHGHELHETMHFKLLTKDGKVIYSNEEFEYYEDVFGEILPHLLDEKTPYSSFFISRGDEAHIEEELFAHAHSKGYKGYKGLGWILVIEHDTEEIFAPIVGIRNKMLIATFGIMMVAVLLGILISYSISNPITKLDKAAEEVGKGNLDVKADIKTKDEVGNLAMTFNSMTTKIKNLKRAKKLQKLEDELTAMEQGYRAKFISAESYRKNKERIEKELKIIKGKTPSKIKQFKL